MKRNALLTVTIVCLYAAFCAAVIGGCFNPDLSTATILCSAEKPDCPPEYTCQTPYCVPKATAMQADLSLSTADGSTAPDLAIPPADMARRGCADGKGYPVGSAWACPGKWGPYHFGIKAVSLCASGFTVCKSANPWISAQALGECRNLKGFYLSDIFANQYINDPPTCAPGLNYRLVYGCGEAARATDYTTLCGYFSQVMVCHQNKTDIKCENALKSIDELDNRTGVDGVLCCPQ